MQTCDGQSLENFRSFSATDSNFLLSGAGQYIAIIPDHMLSFLSKTITLHI